jgi:homoserine O-succinyltransferase/O-acetyltransferase
MKSLTIALVNNMPDAALRTAERQFCELLSLASAGFDLRVRLFSLPGYVRSDAALAHLSERYEEIDALWSGGAVDGLIVTGTEPRLPAIEDEPFWPSFTRTLSWAESETVSAIFSCHAAHAAVRYFDGILRHELPRKLCGLYACVKSADHFVLADAPAAWVTPHSRYNDLPEAALVAHGYTILSRSAEAGVDLFASERKSLFLFMQGHPEYDAAALLREYRRDVGRFLAGQRDDYPDLPVRYFDAAAAAGFEQFKLRAVATRDAALLPQFPLANAEKSLVNTWRRPALCLYRNWLTNLADRGRSKSLRKAPPLEPAERA